MNSIKTFASFAFLLSCALGACAQDGPSYAKHVRPVFAKYCVECHNAKDLKGGLNLETFKAILEGGDRGDVLVPGQPDKSWIVNLVEGTQKPIMPPKTAKHRPTKEEIALLRAWVKAGAKDDSALIKVALPDIKPSVGGFAPVSALSFDPLGRFLIIGRNRDIEFRPLRADMPKVGIAPADRVTGFAPSDDGSLLAVAYGSPGVEGKVSLFHKMNASEAEIPERFPGLHKDVILDLAISPDKRWLATAGYDARVHLTPLGDKAGRSPVLLKDHSDAVYALAFSPDSRSIATCSADRAVKIWDVATGKLLLTLSEANDWLYAVAWSADGVHLAAGGLDKSIRLYAIRAGAAKLLHSVFAHEAGVQKLIFGRDGTTLYSLGQEGVAKAWKLDPLQELRIYDRQPGFVQTLAVAPDQKQIALGRHDGIVVVLDEATGKVRDELKPTPPAKKAAPAKEAKDAAPFPLQKETADNDSPVRGTPITLPASVHGTLDRAGDIDFFRFHAVKGQQIGVQVRSKDIGSKVDPYLQLVDLRGALLAESSDGLLGYTFTADGDYALGIRDRELKGGAGMSYRLNVGPIPIVTSVFPLGLQKGQEREFRLEGVFLDNAKVRLKAAADAVPGARLNLPVTSKHGPVLGKTQVVVGEFPEATAEPSPSRTSCGHVATPGVGNGALAKPGAADVWTFTARKGERLILEVEANRLGSPLDPVIEILDKAGQPLERAVLRCQAKTYVTFRDHNDVQPNIRIEAWSDLSVNDYVYVGGQLLRIDALPTHPDADCNFFAAGGRRTGFLDTTPVHVALNEPMYKVSIHPPGSKFPPNGFPVFSIPYRNDDGGAGYGRDSRLFFDPPADGAFQIRISDARGSGGPGFAYRLIVRPPRPGFNVRFSPTTPSIGRGASIPISVTADRIDGYQGPIQVRLENLPPGFHAPATDIEAEHTSTAFALFVDEKATMPAKTSPLKLSAEAVIDGKKITREASGETPKVIDPGDIVTRTVESEVMLKPGGITRLTVVIERKNGFSGRIPLEVRGLPHGVRVLDIGLNGILINETETRRTMQIYAEPWVTPTDHPIVVLSRREGKNTEHGAKSVMLKITK
ncbi:MAG: c-type cytochrome domain-containing protein [Gemmataceae bacterium]